MSSPTDQIVELDLGIRPEAAVSGAVVVQTESATYLTFNAMRPTNRIAPSGGFFMEDAGTALVYFDRCILSRFGHPNDEARWKHPRYKDASYGIYEVRNSSWIAETVQANQYSFPSTSSDYVSKHFLFTFHDSTFECLADALDLQVFQEPYASVFERVRQRVLSS